MRYERHEKELKKYINLGPRRIIDVFQQRLIPDIERELAEKHLLKHDEAAVNCHHVPDGRRQRCYR